MEHARPRVIVVSSLPLYLPSLSSPAQACRVRDSMLQLLVRVCEPWNRLRLFIKQLEFLTAMNPTDPTTCPQFQVRPYCCKDPT